MNWESVKLIDILPVGGSAYSVYQWSMSNRFRGTSQSTLNVLSGNVCCPLLKLQGHQSGLAPFHGKIVLSISGLTFEPMFFALSHLRLFEFTSSMDRRSLRVYVESDCDRCSIEQTMGFTHVLSYPQ